MVMAVCVKGSAATLSFILKIELVWAWTAKPLGAGGGVGEVVVVCFTSLSFGSTVCGLLK